MEASSKVYFHKRGTTFRIAPKANLNLHERLPVGTYNIDYDACSSQFYLETIEDFELSGKIYGDVVRSSSRILNTFLDRRRSTGVLLVGEKGSGKTLLAQYTSINAAREKGIPTIVVNKPWHGDQFNSFIQSIRQPVVILMDEFEKVYSTDDDENHQEQILTLFDGVYASQKLFLLTCNDKHRMDGHMMNRPGRLYYLLEFNGLDSTAVREYCEDNLLQKDYIPAIVSIAATFQKFNFDMLKAMVEDMNRYNESPSEVLKYLNIRPDTEDNESFRVKLILDGMREDKARKTWYGNPLNEVICIEMDDDETEEDEAVESNEEEGKRYYFSAKNLLKVDPKTRALKLKNEAGHVLILTPAPDFKASLNYDALTRFALKRTPSNASCNVVSVNENETLTEEEEYQAMAEDYCY